MAIFTHDNKRIDRFLDTIGDGTGSPDANVDGSVTPVLFRLNPPATGALILSRMIVEVRDNLPFDAQRYGSIINGLSNGLEVGFFDPSGAMVTDLTDGKNVKTNAGWGQFCYDVDLKEWGAGDKFLLARWSFLAGGSLPILDPIAGNSFGVKVNDNLTALNGHGFFLQGWERESR